MKRIDWSSSRVARLVAIAVLVAVAPVVQAAQNLTVTYYYMPG